MSQNNIKSKDKVRVVINASDIVSKNVDPLLNTCLEKINELPESKDINRVLEIKEKVESGKYDFDDQEKLKVVVNKMLNASIDEDSLSYPVFDR